MFPIRHLSSAISRRPRLLNSLHSLSLVKAQSQTNSEELACLKRFARGHKVAVEIGTYMGVSAAVIAKALTVDGRLYCVDPWESLPSGKENPCWTICRRELRRNNVLSQIIFLQGFSGEMEEAMPEEFDFIFVDGDHSYSGLQTDWHIVLRHLAPSGIVCLHDTTVPSAEPYRKFGSVAYFDEVIKSHQDFEWLECCYSLNVLRRLVRDG